MDFNEFEFEKNLQNKTGGKVPKAPKSVKAKEKKPAPEEAPKSNGIDINSIHIKDADDAPINTCDSETPRDRAAKLAAWEAQKGIKSKPRKNGGKKAKGERRIPKSAVYIFCVLLASILLTLISWLAIKDCFAFNNKVSEDILIVVEDGEGLSKITKKLSSADIIDFPMAFRFYYKFVKRGTKVQYGTHYFKKGDDYDTILRKLAQPTESRETASFLVAEGKTQADVVSILSRGGFASAGDVSEAIKFTSFDDFDFLDDIPERAARLEGYLFPAKYEIYVGESATSIIVRMLKKFDAVFDDLMRLRARELDMTIDEVVTLASVIQAEAGSEDEMPNVSSVFHNRLKDPSYGYLQSCATVQYTMKERRDVLTNKDISVDNRYNTYKYPGLPVGPICNPGLAAIEAALYPAETDYYYFVSNGKGNNIFSRTYEEHVKAKRTVIRNGEFITGTNITSDK